MKAKLISIAAVIMLVLAAAPASSAPAPHRILAQVYSGVATGVDGYAGFNVGSKVLVYMNPNLRIGGNVTYNRLLDNQQDGAVAFVVDGVVPIGRHVEFFVGTHAGMIAGTRGTGMYLEPGLGFMFNFSQIGFELRAAARLPYYLSDALQPKRDFQAVTTLSFVFGKW